MLLVQAIHSICHVADGEGRTNGLRKGGIVTYKIALIPGDGVGPEVVGEGVGVLEAAGELYGINFDWVRYPNGARHYLKTGEIVSEEQLREMKGMDAIYFGAVGDPKVKTGILEKGLLLKMRSYFDQYVNLRPTRAFPGSPCPLAGRAPDEIQFYVVRENTEDFYVGLGSRFKGTKNRASMKLERALYEMSLDVGIEMKKEGEIAYQIGLVSRKGAERIIKYAFELAKKKGLEKVTSVDKANVLSDIYGLWREVLGEVASGYAKSGISAESQFVDNAAMQFVRNPGQYQVIVAPNMFGDILTDLGSALQGSIGCAPSGNINPEGVSMFEPIHGSAPDIAGRGIANPIGAILAGAMMMDELGEAEASSAIESAVRRVLYKGKIKTADLGGKAGTPEMGAAIIRELNSQ